MSHLDGECRERPGCLARGGQGLDGFCAVRGPTGRKARQCETAPRVRWRGSFGNCRRLTAVIIIGASPTGDWVGPGSCSTASQKKAKTGFKSPKTEKNRYNSRS